MTIVLFSSAAVSVCKFRLDFVNALKRRGHEVIIIVGEGALEECALIEQAGAPCHNLAFNRTGMNPVADMAALLRLFRLLRSIKYDHMVCYAHKAAIYGLVAHSRKAKCWIMLSGLGYAFTGGGAKRRFVRWLFGWIYPTLWSRCSGLLLLNPDDRRALLDMGMIGRRPVVCVLPGEGVPLAEFPCSPVQVQQTPRFLMISRLLVDKGVREYVAAARIIRGQFPQAEFRLVGPNDPNPAAITAAEIERWKVEGIIQYYGAQSDVRPILRECTVYVLPSYREGTPRTVLEAMATGRAVITTDAPGCRETIYEAGPADRCGVREGRNGFLVPIKSVDGLVEAMGRFINDPALAVRFGFEGRRIAEEYYDVHKVNQKMFEFMGLSSSANELG